MSNATAPNADQISALGHKIGNAIALDALASDMPRTWTGLDAQDGDQLTAAGITPDSPEWEQAECAARDAFLVAVGR
jgi:hypothetical protein